MVLLVKEIITFFKGGDRGDDDIGRGGDGDDFVAVFVHRGHGDFDGSADAAGEDFDIVVSEADFDFVMVFDAGFDGADDRVDGADAGALADEFFGTEFDFDAGGGFVVFGSFSFEVDDVEVFLLGGVFVKGGFENVLEVLFGEFFAFGFEFFNVFVEALEDFFLEADAELLFDDFFEGRSGRDFFPKDFGAAADAFGLDLVEFVFEVGIDFA